MSIPFDPGAADSLIAAAEEAAEVVRNQGASRRAAAEEALESFSGTYSDLFESACGVESEDRSRLAGVLDDVVEQVKDAKQKAEEEEQRLADLADWNLREDERDRRKELDLSGMTPLTDTWDPKPSETPIEPPSISAPFSATARSRDVGQVSSSKSSADPVDLFDYVSVVTSKNETLRGKLTTLNTAWSGFTSNCSWVPVDSASFLTGFEDLIDENEADADWIERIAAAFELAGSGGVLDPSQPISDALIGAASETFVRYRGKLRIPGGNAVIPEELLNPQAKDANWQKELYKGRWYSINPENGMRVPRNAYGPVALSPAAQNPNGWRDRLVFSTDPKYGTPPPWATKWGRGLGVLGGGLTLWGSYADSYNGTLTAHPDWDEDQRVKRATEDMVIVGGSTIGGSILAGVGAGAAIGSIVPGPGTAVGAVVGVIVGLGAGIFGGWAGQKFGENVSDWYHGDEEGEILAPGPYDQPPMQEDGAV